IYAIRRSALEGKDQRDYVLGIAADVVRELVDTFCPREQHPDQWNATQFLAESNAQFGIDMKAAGADPSTLSHDQLADAAAEAVTKRYEEKEKQFGADLMRWLERRNLRLRRNQRVLAPMPSPPAPQRARESRSICPPLRGKSSAASSASKKSCSIRPARHRPKPRSL